LVLAVNSNSDYRGFRQPCPTPRVHGTKANLDDSDLKPGQKKRLKSALARKRNRKKRNRDSAQNEIR
jgi:hypothetical protein